MSEFLALQLSTLPSVLHVELELVLQFHVVKGDCWKCRAKKWGTVAQLPLASRLNSQALGSFAVSLCTYSNLPLAQSGAIIPAEHVIWKAINSELDDRYICSVQLPNLSRKSTYLL